MLWTIGFLALLGTQLVAAGAIRHAVGGQPEAGGRAGGSGRWRGRQRDVRDAGSTDPHFQADGTPRTLRIGNTAVSGENRELKATGSTLTPPPRYCCVRCWSSRSARRRPWQNGWPPRSSTGEPAGANARDGGAKAPQYRAAGLPYGPPGTPFQSVDELADVLGMTPALFARLAPHLTVFTDGDPDLSTRDPVVSSALRDISGAVDDTSNIQDTGDAVLRIAATAAAPDGARLSILVVASAEFQGASPQVNILLRQRLIAPPTGATSAGAYRLPPAQ